MFKSEPDTVLNESQTGLPSLGGDPMLYGEDDNEILGMSLDYSQMCQESSVQVLSEVIGNLRQQSNKPTIHPTKSPEGIKPAKPSTMPLTPNDLSQQTSDPAPPNRQPYARILKKILEADLRNGSEPPPVQAPPAAAEGNEKPDKKEASPPQDDKWKDTFRSGSSLRNLNYPQHLHFALRQYVGDCGGYPAFGEIMADMHRDYGSPKDPMAKMLIQQLVLLHEMLPVYHRRGLEAQSSDVAKVYLAAAHRTAEDFRKAASLLREHLLGISKVSFTVVNQQNIAKEQNITVKEESSEPRLRKSA